MQNSRNETTTTGKLIEEVFGRKLKQVISVVAIEQATQRTAEWATQINQAAKNLGTTAEQLQTLNHIASATGVADSAVTGLFDNIQKSAQDAIKGNGDLIASFSKLGLSIGDLMSMTNAQIFSKVLSNIPKGLSQSPDQMMRQSVQNITGTPENTLASIQAGYNATPGSDLTGKSKGLSDAGAIASEANVQELNAVWSQLKTSLGELGTSLLPVASILVSIAKTIVDAFTGAADIIKNILTLNLKHALAQIVGVIVNGGAGVAKMVIGLFSHIPGMKNFAKTWEGQINEGQGIANKALGLSEIDKNRQEAIGNAAVMVASVGEGALASGTSYGLRGVASGASKVGLRGVAKWAGTKAENIDEGLIATRAVRAQKEAEANERVRQYVIQKELNNAGYAQTDETYIASGLKGKYAQYNGMRLSKLGYEGTGETLSEASSNRIYQEAEDKAQLVLNSKKYKAVVAAKFGEFGAVGLASAVGASGLKGIDDTIGNITPSQNIKPIGLPMSFMQMAGGSANLKMGGMFGVGSPMDKLVSLNQKMNEHLGTIAKNTGHSKPGGLNDTIEKHNKVLHGHGMTTNSSVAGGI